MNWYDDFGDQVRLDVPLAPLTWFGLGGPAKFFATPRDLGQLQAIAARLRHEEIPIHVLGSGANLLVNDEGVDGAVVSTRPYGGTPGGVTLCQLLPLSSVI